MSNPFFTLTSAALLLLGLCAPALAFQQKGGREPKTRANPPPQTEQPPKNQGAVRSNPGRADRTPAKTAGSGRKPEPAPAGLVLSVTPPDSKIILDGTEYRAEQGTFARSAIKRGRYKVVVRREGYREEEYELGFEPGRVTSLSVSLEPLYGTIDVAPAVAGAEINIRETGTNGLVGHYVGRASNIRLSPGRYQVFVSKEGYKTAIREITVKPSEIVLLEPPLEPLPKASAAPARRPVPPPFRPDSAMLTQTSAQGKFVVVVLTGRSGDTSNAFGAVDVTLNRAGHVWVARVSGLLTGHPCQVDFVRLENVAEYSFVEPPGVQNQWARAMVRIRPKENGRPVRFLINWKGIRAQRQNEPQSNLLNSHETAQPAGQRGTGLSRGRPGPHHRVASRPTRAVR